MFKLKSFFNFPFLNKQFYLLLFLFFLAGCCCLPQIFSDLINPQEKPPPNLAKILTDESQTFKGLVRQYSPQNGSERFAAYTKEVLNYLNQMDTSKYEKEWFTSRITILREFLHQKPGLRTINSENKEVLSVLLISYLNCIYQEELLSDLQKLISYPTYKKEDVENWQNPSFIEMSMFFSDLANKMNLEFKNYEGKVYEFILEPTASETGLKVKGSSLVEGIIKNNKEIGILAHADVVPALEENWIYPPFKGEIANGCIYGRGAEDDKGPLISALYALRTIQDSGIQLDHKFRMIIGTTEETSWETFRDYLKNNPAPDISFVVDAAFPVVVAEKGALSIKIISEPTEAYQKGYQKGDYFLLKIDGGIVANQVPDSAFALTSPPNGTWFKDDHICNKDQRNEREYRECDDPVGVFLNLFHEWVVSFNNSNPYAYLEVEGCNCDQDLVIKAKGKTAHASLPELGHNAILDLASFYQEFSDPNKNLAAYPQTDHRLNLLIFINQYFGSRYDGSALGITYNHPLMGAVSINVGLLGEERRKNAYSLLDIRYPEGISTNEIAKKIEDSISKFNSERNTNLSMEITQQISPIYVDPEQPFVKKLLQAYKFVTGEEGKAISIGGTTYAKAIPNAVSFGPLMLNEEFLAHAANEKVSIDSLLRNSQIYTIALLNLSNSDQAH